MCFNACHLRDDVLSQALIKKFVVFASARTSIELAGFPSPNTKTSSSSSSSMHLVDKELSENEKYNLGKRRIMGKKEKHLLCSAREGTMDSLVFFHLRSSSSSTTTRTTRTNKNKNKKSNNTLHTEQRQCKLKFHSCS